MSTKEIIKAINQLSIPKKIMIGAKLFSSLTNDWDIKTHSKKEKLKNKFSKGLKEAQNLAAGKKKGKKNKTLSELINELK